MKTLFKKLFGPSVDFQKLINEGAVIIDVRTKGEFDAGHIPGSKNIALQILTNKLNDIKNMNKPIIAVCASGMRSAQAKSILKNNGVEVYNGGSWLKINRIVSSKSV